MMQEELLHGKLTIQITRNISIIQPQQKVALEIDPESNFFLDAGNDDLSAHINGNGINCSGIYPSQPTSFCVYCHKGLYPLLQSWIPRMSHGWDRTGRFRCLKIIDSIDSESYVGLNCFSSGSSFFGHLMQAH